MRVSSCIKRDPVACALELKMNKFSIGETKGGSGKLGYGLTCKDYMVINGEKTALCGQLNPPKSLIFPPGGPESIFFHTDDDTTAADRGFSLEYIHHHSCDKLKSKFFKYPGTK